MQSATKDDWNDLQSMPPAHERIELGLKFAKDEMRNLQRGFIPDDQNQKWFLYYESDTLHCHRSWTGIKMFEVVFEALGGGAVARFARANLDPEFYSGSLDEARETLLDLLRYYATDEAHEPYQSSFVTAINEAAKPNYLGSPVVISELLKPFFWRTLCRELSLHFSELDALPKFEETTYNDVLALNQRITSALSGEIEAFHGLESWRNEQGMGRAIIRQMGLDADWYADENLGCIVSEGLAGVSLQLSQIVTEWAREEPPLDFEALLQFTGILQHFTGSVVMGTHAVIFPDVTLADLTWANRSRFVQLDADNAESSGELTETSYTGAKSPSFEELLRQLKALDEDHNPEHDEEFEEDPEDEALLSGPPVHPRPDANGNVVKLLNPSTPTPQWTWTDASSTAVVVPDGPIPDVSNNIPIACWRDAPRNSAGWEALAEGCRIPEPDFVVPKGKKAAAGVAVLEKDGRVWLVAPSNAFGGYPVTFPKGTRDPGMSLQASALREAFEEAGLAVMLTRHLVDVPRSTSFTRYYLARRVGGNPAEMGWESQAVLLAPIVALPALLTNKNDLPIIQALQGLGRRARREFEAV